MRAFLALAAVAVLAAGCSSSTTAESGSSAAPQASSSATGTSPDASVPASGAASSPAASGDYIAQVKAEVEQLLGQGSYEAPPTTAPAHEAGKVIAVIDSTAATAQAVATEATLEAAKALGWETVFYDTKLDPTLAGPMIESAIARKVDAITLDVVDCRYIKPALTQAKAAGIPVIAIESYDCNDTDPSEPSYFTETVKFPMGNQQDYYDSVYRALALYPIAALDGASNAVYFVDNVYQASVASIDIIKGVYAPCETCSLSVEAFPFEEFGNLKARTQTVLLKNPDINTLIPGYTDITTAGVLAAADESGREFMINAGDSSSPAALELVSTGKANYGYGFTAGWKGYALMDTVLRVFAGESAVNSGMGINLFDADHNMDASGQYIPPFDYAALYKAAWGVA